MLLHRFEQGALGLRSGAVDFVGEHDVREDGAAPELEAFPPLCVVIDHGRPEDVRGHQVGRELNARESERERLAQRSHEHRLAEPWHPLEERVPPGEEAREDAVDHLLVANDCLPDLRPERLDPLLELGNLLPRCARVAHGFPAFGSLVSLVSLAGLPATSACV